MQYKCTETLTQLNTKREQGLLISCVASFTAIVFLIVIFYLSKTSVLDYKEWDVETLTASDYTVEYNVT